MIAKENIDCFHRVLSKFHFVSIEKTHNDGLEFRLLSLSQTTVRWMWAPCFVAMSTLTNVPVRYRSYLERSYDDEVRFIRIYSAKRGKPPFRMIAAHISKLVRDTDARLRSRELLASVMEV